MTRSVVTFKQFFCESTEDELNQYEILYSELQQSNSELYFKHLLNNENLKYAEQYRIDTKRRFSIDFAFPDKKIAVEINGPHHYQELISNWNNIPNEIIDSSKNDDVSMLLSKFQLRHQFIKEMGWRIIEIPVSLIKVQHESFLLNLINEIKNINFKFEFDYSSYVPKQKLKFKNTEESINLLKKLIETKTYNQIAEDLISKLNLPNTIKYIAKLISDFCVQNKLKPHRLSSSREKLQKVQNMIELIPNKENMGSIEMAKVLSQKISEVEGTPVTVTHSDIKNWLSRKVMPDWRSQSAKMIGRQPILSREITDIINSIPNKRRIGLVQMAEILSNKMSTENNTVVITNRKLSDLIRLKLIRDWRSNK